MGLMVRPVSLLAFALLIVAMAQLRVRPVRRTRQCGFVLAVHADTQVGFRLVLAGYRSDFAVSAWRMRRRLIQQASTIGSPPAQPQRLTSEPKRRMRTALPPACRWRWWCWTSISSSA